MVEPKVQKAYFLGLGLSYFHTLFSKYCMIWDPSLWYINCEATFKHSSENGVTQGPGIQQHCKLMTCLSPSVVMVRLTHSTYALCQETPCGRRASPQPPLSSRCDSTSPAKLEHLPQAQRQGQEGVFWWMIWDMAMAGNPSQRHKKSNIHMKNCSIFICEQYFERRNWFMLSQAYSPWEAIQNCTFVPLIISQLSMSEMGHEAFPSWFVCFWQNKPLNVCMKAPCRCSWRNHLSSS